MWWILRQAGLDLNTPFSGSTPRFVDHSNCGSTDSSGEQAHTTEVDGGIIHTSELKVNRPLNCCSGVGLLVLSGSAVPGLLPNSAAKAVL